MSTPRMARGLVLAAMLTTWGAVQAPAQDAKPAEPPAPGAEGKGRGKRGGGDGAAAGSGSGGAPGSGSGRGGRGRDSGPVVVRVESAAKKLVPRVTRVVALLQGRKQADVYSKVTGRIASLGPNEGEAVKQGQTLFRVDRADPGESFLDTPVLSPLTGWVGRWHVQNVGEQVTAAAAVATVVDDQALRATAQLPAGDWLAVSKGIKVKAILAAETRDAQILTVARAADPISGRGSVTVEIDNPKRDWRAGLYATLAFELDPRERMLISATSLIITDKGSFVYVVDGETAKRVPVTYDVYDSDTVEILTGIDANVQVVSAGANLLGDKSPIRIADATPAAAEPSR